ncbi:uncharacterized protein HKW66_Vig0257070 [Vigna angularis]|uniref:Hydrophobic seed protein domain-containing protein n=1 Tax=Phaseolus angularis TaxID=3914 RepID=A0A8T0JW69_PHAAN|nr:uncharacterized protein HKW66_Vig0257070 [Vigna angularis]
MMDSISKMMRILCWLLILASELRRSESSDQFLPHSVAVKIANMLTLKQLTLHCRDKNHDLGCTSKIIVLPLHAPMCGPSDDLYVGVVIVLVVVLSCVAEMV